jgi:hypothetical protein
MAKETKFPQSNQMIDKLKDALFPGGDVTTTSPEIISNAIKDFNQYKNNSGRSGYINLVKSVISKTNVGIDSQTFSSDASGSGAYTPSAFGSARRMERYALYESIISNISYCKRSLDILTDNILSPDDITKVSLLVKPSDDESSDDSNFHIKFIKRVIEKTKLEKYLNRIVKNTLKSGDYFCEIADGRTALTSKSFLSEDYFYRNSEDLVEWVETIDKKRTKKIVIDFSLLEEARERVKLSEDVKVKNGIEDNKKTKNKEVDLQNFSDINYIFHDGRYVIKLQSELYSLCFGYLIFPKVQILNTMNPQEDVINGICAKILTQVKDKIPTIKGLKNPDELKDILKSILSNANFNNSLTIRYVPPDNMVHFKLPSEKFFPYGESIFDGVAFNAKVFMALQTALAIQRINRSTEKRKILIEVGLPRDAKKLVESLKMELHKRKVSLGDYKTIDSIPSSISTFEDMYIPQKDGSPFVDIQSFSEGNIDTGNKTDEIKLLRDQIVGGLVPPSFLGIDETTRKFTLSQENILFARSIINFQKIFSEQINELISKILYMIDPEIAMVYLDDIIIAFPPPKNLQYETESRNVSDLVSMIQSLKDLGLPIEYLKKKYLSMMDWTEIEKFEKLEKIDKDLGSDEEKIDDQGF